MAEPDGTGEGRGVVAAWTPWDRRELRVRTLSPDSGQVSPWRDQLWAQAGQGEGTGRWQKKGHRGRQPRYTHSHEPQRPFDSGS